MLNTELCNTAKHTLKSVESVHELAKMLNSFQLLLNTDENTSSIQIKANSISYYSTDKLCPDRYSQFTIKKKSGKERIINAPHKRLKEIQKSISAILQYAYPISNHAYGFVLERNVVQNAALHVGKQYVYNIDLKDFFHSFDLKQVKLALLNPDFNVISSEKIAYTIASLCTHTIQTESGELKNVLPQGAPTSPVLTNIICNRLDRKLAGLAKRFNAIYSRYADDITFSCDINIFNFESFQNELNRIIKTENKLEIQTEKSRIQHRSFRQEVTGIIVNEKININQRYIKGIRMYLTLVERYGIEKATMLYQKDYQLDKGYQPKEKFNLKYILGGKINYLSMIRGKEDALTQKLAERWAIAFNVKKSNKTPDGEIDMNEILDLLLKSDLDKAMNKFLDHKK